MITTLLLDLDGTLLENEMGRFLPAYFELVAEHLAPAADPQRLKTALVAGVQRMASNTEPRRTLRQVFDPDFYAQLNLAPGSLQSQIDDFYERRFPSLRALTRPQPEARRIIERAQREGLEIAIISNPLFPRTAIAQRLDWAGVPETEFPYALLEGYEATRFSKPHPEFFAETLARLRRRPDEALAVGDSWNEDIQPAASLGLRTWWIHVGDGGNAGEGSTPTMTGSLSDLERWLSEDGPQALPEAPPILPGALPALLAGNLAGALDLLEAHSGADWKAPPGPGEWSLTEIACHLRDVEAEVHTVRFQRLVEEPNPFMAGIDSDAWAVERDYRSQDGRRALEAFGEARVQNVEYLRSLPAESWSRQMRHSILGPSTLADMVSLSIEHDRLHLAQIAGVLGATGAAHETLLNYQGPEIPH